MFTEFETEIWVRGTLIQSELRLTPREVNRVLGGLQTEVMQTESGKKLRSQLRGATNAFKRTRPGGVRFEGRALILHAAKSCQPGHKFVTTLRWTFTFTNPRSSV